MSARLLTTLGLGVEVVGVMFLAWSTDRLVKSAGGWGGGIPQEVLNRVRWPTRIGWFSLVAGLLAQAVAVWWGW